LHGVQGVEGSNPSVPTKFLKGLRFTTVSLLSFLEEKTRQSGQDHD
jgi:hypothetical protein